MAMKQRLDYISDCKFFSSDLVSEYYILLFQLLSLESSLRSQLV